MHSQHRHNIMKPMRGDSSCERVAEQVTGRSAGGWAWNYMEAHRVPNREQGSLAVRQLQVRADQRQQRRQRKAVAFHRQQIGSHVVHLQLLGRTK